MTRSRVMMGGALSGAWLGAFVGLIFSLFEEGETLLRRGARIAAFFWTQSMVADAGQRRAYLGVEQRRRDGAEFQQEDFDILAGGDLLKIDMNMPFRVVDIFSGVILLCLIASEVFVRNRVQWGKK